MTSGSLERFEKAFEGKAKRDEVLAPYTAMRVGGPADLLLVCRTSAEVERAVRQARELGLPWRVLGGGCNVLVADSGVRGLVIVNKSDQVRMDDTGRVWAEAGASMSGLAQGAAGRGLVGLEWAAGLPGSVGGAVVGNAGAFGGDVASVLEKVTILGRDGNVTEEPNDWLEFFYRGSRIKLQEAGDRPVVLAATFSLQDGDPEQLAQRVSEILHWRKTRHPAGATMGSTFKNPPGRHAGRVIEEVGLKGTRVGGAEVSEQHCNFIMNTGGATAADVLSLVRTVQAEVKHRCGVELELEVELVGSWGEDDGQSRSDGEDG